MERRPFGRTNLTVPVVGMGTWQTFDVRGEQEASRRAIVDAAFDTDASFFDSSPMYGEAERLLGTMLHGRRNRALVATKLWTADDREADLQIEAALGYFGGRVSTCIRFITCCPHPGGSISSNGSRREERCGCWA